MGELYELLTEIGIPVAYSYFLTTKDPPFIIYKRISSNNFEADNVTYYKQEKYHIEIYTKKRDVDLERQLEDLLDENEITYEIISESYINSEKIYQVIYEINI